MLIYLSGYYADPELGCQAYHVCLSGSRKVSFLCPNGTIFHQAGFTCEWWYVLINHHYWTTGALRMIHLQVVVSTN